MFAYNPTPDRSGEILGASTAQAAAIRAQGTAQFSQALSDSVNTAVSIYTKSQQKAADNKMTSDYLDSMAGQFSTTKRPGTESPYMTSDELEKFSKSSLGAKQGMIVPKQAMYEQDLKNSYQQLQMQSYLDRMRTQAGYQSAARQPASNEVVVNSASNYGVPASTTQPNANPYYQQILQEKVPNRR